MTIASEISRIKNDKFAIKTALQGKGVTVGDSVKIDSYYCCINSISGGVKKFKYIAVGGGAGSGGCNVSGRTFLRGGGGGGEVLTGECIATNNSVCVCIGAGGGRGCYASPYSCATPTNGGNTKIGNITAKGGCISFYCGDGAYYYGGTSGSGCLGGCTSYCYTCGGYTGGGGAGGKGEYFSSSYISCCCVSGGKGICGYGGGGGGLCQLGQDGGGNGIVGCCNATNCGGGGGSAPSSCYGGKGGKGVVEICYPSDGSRGITNATGGTKTTVTEGGITYCKHTFTSNGTFCIGG